MKSKFAVNDSIQTPTASGVIIEAAPFADHVEYLVQFKDRTATWFHEEQITKPVAPKPTTAGRSDFSSF